jgi:hypothetical protein
VAEDTAAPKCKRGHPFIPENIWVRPSDGARQCRTCRKARKARADAVYDATPKRKAARRRVQAQYGATTKGWLTSRRYKTKGLRETVQAELHALEKEEEECLRLLGKAIAKK